MMPLCARNWPVSFLFWKHRFIAHDCCDFSRSSLSRKLHRHRSSAMKPSAAQKQTNHKENVIISKSFAAWLVMKTCFHCSSLPTSRAQIPLFSLDQDSCLSAWNITLEKFLLLRCAPLTDIANIYAHGHIY